MADDTTFPYWIPTVIGVGISTRRAWQSVASKQVIGPTLASSAREALLAAQEAVVGVPTAKMGGKSYDTVLTSLMESQSWRRMGESKARNVIAEATRVSLLKGNQMGIGEINTVTRNILDNLPFEGTTVNQDMFAVAAGHVRKAGDVPTFVSVLRNNKINHMFMTPEQIASVQAGAEKTKRFVQTLHGGPAYHIKPRGPITFFDLETGGLNIGKSPILEIGIQKIDPKTGNVIRSYQTKVLPFPGAEISPEAAKLIGYSEEGWKGAIPLEQALREASPYLEGEVLGGQNIRSFDVPMLEAEFKRAGIKMPGNKGVIDLMSLTGGKSLEAITSELGIAQPAAHTAMGDVFSTAEAYQRLTKNLNDKSDWWKSKVSAKETQLLDELFEISGHSSRLAVSGITKIPGQPTVAELSIRMGELGTDANFPLNITLDPNLSVTPNARNITNKIILPGASGAISYPQYVAKQMGEKLIPELTQIAEQHQPTNWLARRMVKDRIMSFNAEMSKFMTYVSNVNHPSVRIAEALNRDIVAAPHLGTGWTGAKINAEEELSNLVKSGLYPYSSKRIAEGKMLTYDPRNFWLYGADFPLARQPAQFVARGWTPSSGALSAMRENPIMGSISREVPFAMTADRARFAELGMKSPQMLTMYALGGKLDESLLAAGLEKDQVLIRKRMAAMFSSESVQTVHIGLEEGINPKVAEWIQKNIGAKNVSPLSLKGGQTIGRELGTGALSAAVNIAGVRQSLIGMQVSGKEAILSVRNVVNAKEGQAFKIFGSMKATVVQPAKGQFKDIASSIGNQFIAQNVDAFAYVDELRKNRGLLKEQMVSALHVLSSSQMKAGSLNNTMSAEISGFLNDPGKFIGSNLKNEMDIIRTASRWGMHQEYIQLIGGGAEASGVLTGAELAEARGLAGGSLIHKSGGVLGLATGYVAEFEHTMGTTPMKPPRGSVEPRALMQLIQHEWPTAEGDASKLVAGDIASRMRSYGGDIKEITKALDSVTGTLPKDIKTVKISDLGRGIGLSNEGYALDLGMKVKALGDVSQIYVPPQNVMQRFKSLRSRRGRVLGTEMVRAYDKIVGAVRRVQNNGDDLLAQKQLNESSKGLLNTLKREAGAALYGRGAKSEKRGALRQRFAGSSYSMFENVNTAVNAIEQDVMYTSEALGKRMYKDQIRAAQTQEQRIFLKEQRAKFLAGERVAGVVRRDPAIGPHGTALTWIQRSREAGTKKRYFIQAPTRQLSTTIEAAGLGAFEINPAATFGMAADYDADRGVLAFIGNRKTDKAVEEMLSSGRYRQEYSEFAMKAGTMKKILSKFAELPGVEERTGQGGQQFKEEVDQLIFEANKLKVIKTGTPLISSALNEAKIAMSAYKPKSSAMFNIFAETLEQFPISGKHIRNVEDVKMAEEFAANIRGINSPSGEEFERLVARTEQVYGQEIQQGIAIRDVKSGAATTLKINYREMWNEVRDAMSQGKTPGGAIDTWRRLSRDSKTVDNMSVSSFTSMYHHAQQGKLDDLSLLAMRDVTELGAGRLVSSNSIMKINETIKQLGARAKEWGKPALVGLAVTTAMVMMTGGPKGQVMDEGPSRERFSREEMNSGDKRRSNSMLNVANQVKKDFTPQALRIPSQQRMDSSMMRSMPAKTVLADMPNANNSRIVVDAEMDNGADRGQLSRMLRSVTGRNEINLNYSDNRRKMTSSSVDDMFEGF